MAITRSIKELSAAAISCGDSFDVILTEVDDGDNEFRRGMKTLVIPAHDAPSCRDITVRCIRIVLPEELDVSGDETRLCDERRFRARFIANYIDAGFTCCTLDD